MTRNLGELWQCPKCGERFVTKNLWHSCGKYTLENLFTKSKPEVFTLYQRVATLVQECGDIVIIPQKTRLCFQARVRFINVVVRRTYLVCEFGFSERYEHPRFDKITQYAPHWFGHRCKVTANDDIDDEFRGWVWKAFEVGQQKHLPQNQTSA